MKGAGHAALENLPFQNGHFRVIALKLETASS